MSTMPSCAVGSELPTETSFTTADQSCAQTAGEASRAVKPMDESHNVRVDACRLLTLPKVEDERGNLTFIEARRQIDFDIERVYYLYDVPGGANRGGHAHKTLRQLAIALSGSFDVIVDDGRRRRRFHLNRAYLGLYIPPMTWREIDNFSGGSVCLVLASAPYDESDYVRDYDEYRRAILSVGPTRSRGRLGHEG